MSEVIDGTKPSPQSFPIKFYHAFKTSSIKTTQKFNFSVVSQVLLKTTTNMVILVQAIRID